MKNENSKAVSESFAMKGGDGPHSYSQNSSFQRAAIESGKRLIQEAIIKKFDPNAISAFPRSPICIADMGCSTGPNTFIAVKNIIEALELKYQSLGLSAKLPEFQVFFNDQVSNDFNTLFNKLPPNRNYFAAGVPGSFYGRLFPRESLHLAHSVSSLNWISKVPDEITDSTSAAFNKGRIHYANAPKEVVDAYANQYQIDMENFLHARAQELVVNGIMALQFPGAYDVILESDVYPGKDLELLGSCLVDMAKVGLVSEEKVDTFNVPMFFAPLKQLKAILERNDDFTIEWMETLNHPHFFVSPNVQMIVSHCRAALEGLIENHFGAKILDELFDRYASKIAESPDMLNGKKLKNVILFVLLKRKPHA